VAIIGQDVAIVGLGLSCQTAHQLRQNAPMMAQLMGEQVAVSRLPFDWMIARPRSVAAMLRNQDYCPASFRELSWSGRPYWPRYDCYFWHEEIAFDHPSRFMLRVHSAAEKVKMIAERRRRIFIVSNTQNALPGIIGVAGGGVDISLDDDALGELQQAIDGAFGPSELYAVTYPHLNRTRRWKTLFELAPDDSDWQGDEDQWANVLRTIYANPPQATPSPGPVVGIDRFSRTRWSPRRTPFAADRAT
jgi:hypothetical protein